MRIVGYSSALIVALVLAIYTWHWFGLPPLVRGPDGEFGARVQATFPVGMTEPDLVRELRDQGFGPPVNAHDLFYRSSATGEQLRIRAQDPSLKYTTFSSFSFFCEVTWWVLWHANQDGKVTDIRGEYAGSCL
jgi:hypothetical protein